MWDVGDDSQYIKTHQNDLEKDKFCKDNNINLIRYKYIDSRDLPNIERSLKELLGDI